MSTSTKLAIEALKKQARFGIKLTDEQTESLVQQCRPFNDTLEALANEIKTIRANSRLSDAAKSEDVSKAKQKATETITEYLAQISRQDVITDLTQRIATKTVSQRKKSLEAFSNADSLGRELREAVLPRMIAEASKKKIDKIQTVSKLALQAAERYNENPGKYETVISALSVGWPWTEDLPAEVISQVSNLISSQTAPEEVTLLAQATGVEQELAKVAEATISDIKSMG